MPGRWCVQLHGHLLDSYPPTPGRSLAHSCPARAPSPPPHPTTPARAAGTFVGRNLVPATIGNIIGGAAFVGTAYALSFGTPGHAGARRGLQPQGMVGRMEDVRWDALLGPTFRCCLWTPCRSV